MALPIITALAVGTPATDRGIDWEVEIVGGQKAWVPQAVALTAGSDPLYKGVFSAATVLPASIPTTDHPIGALYSATASVTLPVPNNTNLPDPLFPLEKGDFIVIGAGGTWEKLPAAAVAAADLFKGQLTTASVLPVSLPDVSHPAGSTYIVPVAITVAGATNIPGALLPLNPGDLLTTGGAAWSVIRSSQPPVALYKGNFTSATVLPAALPDADYPTGSLFSVPVRVPLPAPNNTNLPDVLFPLEPGDSVVLDGSTWRNLRSAADNSLRTTTPTPHGLTVPGEGIQPIRYDAASNAFVQATAQNGDTVAHFVLTTVPSTTELEIMTQGVVTSSHGLPLNEWLYLDPRPTPAHPTGLVSGTDPIFDATPNAARQRVAYGIDANTLYVDLREADVSDQVVSVTTVAPHGLTMPAEGVLPVVYDQDTSAWVQASASDAALVADFVAIRFPDTSNMELITNGIVHATHGLPLNEWLYLDPRPTPAHPTGLVAGSDAILTDVPLQRVAYATSADTLHVALLPATLGGSTTGGGGLADYVPTNTYNTGDYAVANDASGTPTLWRAGSDGLTGPFAQADWLAVGAADNTVVRGALPAYATTAADAFVVAVDMPVASLDGIYYRDTAAGTWVKVVNGTPAPTPGAGLQDINNTWSLNAATLTTFTPQAADFVVAYDTSGNATGRVPYPIAQSLTAGPGINLGGDVVNYAIDALTLELNIDALNDYLLFYDASTNTHRRVPLDVLIQAGGAAAPASTGPTTLLALTDVSEPDYTGHAGHLLAVAPTENGVVFLDTIDGGAF